MSRAPFQVLVLPFIRLQSRGIQYALFRRSDGDGHWQGIAGGGEVGESPLDAAKREAYEEAGIAIDANYVRLDSTCTIPVVQVGGFNWGADVLVIPEHCFGVQVVAPALKLSQEHLEYRWMDYGDARALLHWESNKNALWELDCRLNREKG